MYTELAFVQSRREVTTDKDSNTLERPFVGYTLGVIRDGQKTLFADLVTELGSKIDDALKALVVTEKGVPKRRIYASLEVTQGKDWIDDDGVARPSYRAVITKSPKTGKAFVKALPPIEIVKDDDIEFGEVTSAPVAAKATKIAAKPDESDAGF